jgi:hypothetical protein
LVKISPLSSSLCRAWRYYDDGRATLYGREAASQAVWRDYYAQGKLISRSGVYDDGTTWLI